LIHCAASPPSSPIDNCARDALKLNDFGFDREGVNDTSWMVDRIYRIIQD
jgi:hypothetical protein